jgi:hypothetical protein
LIATIAQPTLFLGVAKSRKLTPGHLGRNEARARVAAAV